MFDVSASLPVGQGWLLDRMYRAGYKINSACFGLAQMAIQAMLLDMLDVFWERLHTIAIIPLDAFSIDGIMGVSKDSALDIYAFFDGLTLYHAPNDYPEHCPWVLKYPYTCQSAYLSAPLTLSVELEKKGGLFSPGKFAGIYTTISLASSFKGLQKVITNWRSINRQPAVLMLADLHHAIAIGYSPKKLAWYVVDADAMKCQPITSAGILATTVMKSLSINGVTATFTTLYGVKQQARSFRYMYHAWRATSDWKLVHEITPRKLRLVDCYGMSWLHIALMEESDGVVITLLQEMVKAKITYSGTKTSLYLEIGFERFVFLLLRSGIDPNLSLGKNNETALALAVKGGYLSIAHGLLKAGANTQVVILYSRPEFDQFIIQQNSFVQSRANLFIKKQQASGGDVVNELSITPYQLACIMGNQSILELFWDNAPKASLVPNPDLLSRLHQYIRKVYSGVITQAGDHRRKQAAYALLFLYQCFIRLAPEDIPSAAHFGDLALITQDILAESDSVSHQKTQVMQCMP